MCSSKAQSYVSKNTYKYNTPCFFVIFFIKTVAKCSAIDTIPIFMNTFAICIILLK